MHLADFIETSKDRLIERWKSLAEESLALDLNESELIDNLPDFIDNLSQALRDLAQSWPALESARTHGRTRMRLGTDVATLSREVALVGEVVLMLASEDELQVPLEQAQRLTHVLGQATAVSIQAYVALRDRQVAEQAAQHYSFIAHEIRNPLTNARMATAMLSTGSEEAARAHHLGRLERALVRLSELVDSSLVRSRLESMPTIDVERLGAVEIARDAYESVAAHAEARAQTIVLDIQPFELEADRKLLLSALSNMLENAVKFTGEGGRITLRAELIEQRVQFEIEDQCGGMPKDLPSRVFQPYVQASQDERGFGLGLAIVKQAVDAHQGSVRVDNRPGQGCTFVIELPVRESQP